ncbi:hypothetical protein KKG66_05585 [bacterium]|nr:hypothetical protein [bacterium]
MVRRTLQLISLLLFIGHVSAFAGGSIFSGNGLGEPQIQGGARAVGLAGGGLGLVDSMAFNTSNPSLAAFSRSALFRMSGQLGVWTVKSDGETDSDGEIAWSDFTVFLPVTGKYKIGLGVEAATRVDLRTFTPREAVFTGSDSVAAYEERAVWNGGTTDIRLVNAYRLSDRLAVGLTLAYSFVNLNRDITLDFESSDYQNAAYYQTARFKGWWTKVGFLWKPADKIGIGAYYRPRSGGDWELEIFENDGSKAILTKRDGDTPSALGGGLSVMPHETWAITADLQTQFWSRRYLGILYDNNDQIVVKDPLFMSVGVEKFAKHDRLGGNMGQWAYRGGFFYRSHYWTNDAGDPVTEYGISLGTSIPVGGWLGRLHIAEEIGSRGSNDFGATENFFRTSLQLEMSEQWFQRDNPRIPK